MARPVRMDGLIKKIVEVVSRALIGKKGGMDDRKLISCTKKKKKSRC